MLESFIQKNNFEHLDEDSEDDEDLDDVVQLQETSFMLAWYLLTLHINTKVYIYILRLLKIRTAIRNLRSYIISKEMN